jgi:hypothetical protein
MPPLTAPTNALISLDPSELNPQNRFQDSRQSPRQEQVPRGPEIDPGRVQDFLNQPSDSGDVPAVTPAELTQDSQLRLNSQRGDSRNPTQNPTVADNPLTNGGPQTADRAVRGAAGAFGDEVLTARPSNNGPNAAAAQETPERGANAESDPDLSVNNQPAAPDAETPIERPGRFQDLNDRSTPGLNNGEGSDRPNSIDRQAAENRAEPSAVNVDTDLLTTTPDTPGDEITPVGANTNAAAGTANDVVNANDPANPNNVAGTSATNGIPGVQADTSPVSAEERAQFQQLTARVNALQTETANDEGARGAATSDGILDRADNGPQTSSAEPSTNDQFAEDNANAPGSVGGTANDAAGNVLPDNPIQSLNG